MKFKGAEKFIKFIFEISKQLPAKLSIKASKFSF
jgi:hypothetical protein